MTRKTIRKSLCLMLAATFAAAGCSVSDQGVTDARSQGSDSQPRAASEYGIVRPNTLEDAIVLPALADSAAYFDAIALGEPSGALAYAPDKVFQRGFVSFGERVWERAGPNRFELSGSDGATSVVFSSDFRNVEFRIGQRRIPLSFEGTLEARRVNAGLFVVLGMSGVEPTEEVYAAAAAGAAAGLLPIVGAIILVVGAIGITCAALVTSCNANATQACAPGGAQVSAPCTISGGTNPSITFGCSWTCTGGGGGGGGGGVGSGPPPTASDTASASAGDDAGDAGDAGDNGDDNGDNGDGGDDEDDSGCGDTGDSDGFHIGSVPGVGSGTMDYASADDDGSGGGGGGGGGGDGGSSTGC